MKAMFYDCGVEDKNEDALCALPMDVEVIPRIGETVDMGPEMRGYVGNVVWRYRAEGSKCDVVIFVYPSNDQNHWTEKAKSTLLDSIIIRRLFWYT